MKQLILTAALLIAGLAGSAQADSKTEEGFTRLDDGKTFKGWKISEHPDTWTIQDGAFVARGPRSHLFYVGEEKPYKDFELRVDVLTKANSNGGIYFHTKFQDEGWPKVGFEAQVNNTYKKDPQKTGSLYNVVKVLDASAKDDEWYTETIVVKGKHITIKVNDRTVVDYTEPDGKKPDADCTRVLDEGTFALQAHDPGSTVYFKNIRVKRLD